MLDLFHDMLSMNVCDNQALAHVWSTGGGIKYLYCTSKLPDSTEYMLDNRLNESGNAILPRAANPTSQIKLENA